LGGLELHPKLQRLVWVVSVKLNVKGKILNVHCLPIFYAIISHYTYTSYTEMAYVDPSGYVYRVVCYRIVCKEIVFSVGRTIACCYYLVH